MFLRILISGIMVVMSTNGARSEKTLHPSLKQLMAEGAGLAASHRGERWTMTCNDVRIIVAQLGEAQAIAAAQAYGAGESQIAIARQCLTKKTKK